MTKYIFVDLDECLFHCRALFRNDADAAQRALVGHEKLVNAVDSYGDDFYGSALRPGALDLLKALREIPDSRLSVLTASIATYAYANNEAHSLGFDSTDIYSRADLQTRTRLDPNRFGSGPVYLIDNLPRHENRIKIQFLWPIATNGIEYIKVPEYWGKTDRPFDAESIQNIVATINDLGNS